MASVHLNGVVLRAGWRCHRGRACRNDLRPLKIFVPPRLQSTTISSINLASTLVLLPSMAVNVSSENIQLLRAILLNTSGKTPLHERFRALFMLKALGNDRVVKIISEGEWASSSLPGSLSSSAVMGR